MCVAPTEKRPRVLIVDNDPNELRTLRIGLNGEGFAVDGVASGDEALDLLKADAYDGVLIELMMPHINGLQLARQIRAHHDALPMLLMSAYHLSAMQLVRTGVGVSGFIPKPYQFEELRDFLWRKFHLEPLAGCTCAEEDHSVDGFSSPFEIPESYASLCLCD